MASSIIVTQVKPPLTVFSKKGRVAQMRNRPHYGLSLCISGQITYTMDGHQFVSRPGSVVLLPQGGCYTLQGDSDGLFPVINFTVQSPISNQILIATPEDPDQCLQDCRALERLFLFENDQLAIFSAFYGLLNRAMGSVLQDGARSSPALQYLERHLSDPTLSNTALAKELGISEVYLRKQFQAQYGTTPKQFILDLRLRKAMQLLTDTTHSVTAISDLCGFSSVYHFCRAFRNRTGQTPTQYAANHKPNII